MGNEHFLYKNQWLENMLAIFRGGTYVLVVLACARCGSGPIPAGLIPTSPSGNAAPTTVINQPEEQIPAPLVYPSQMSYRGGGSN